MDTSIMSEKQEEPSRRPDEQKDVVWSDEVDTAQGVVWGEQISNTIRKLKSLTFFAVGTKPLPPPPATESVQDAALEDKSSNKRKVKGNAGRGGRKPRNTRQNRQKGGPAPPIMGSDETATTTADDSNSAPPVLEPVFGLDDVANYECVSAEGIEMDMKDQIETGVASDRTEETEKHRKRRGNLNGEKPNNTYTEIITTALEENPNGLTVSEIYDYISTRYGYYQPNDDRWKNSVRHNLSISPYFHKGAKSKHGAGHVWTIAEDCKEIRLNRRRSGSGLVPKTVEQDKVEPAAPAAIDMTKLKTETDFAVASILGDYTRACSGLTEKAEVETKHDIPQPSLTLVNDMPHLEPESCLHGPSELGMLNCEEIELHFEGMQSFVDSASTNRILSLDTSETNMCMFEDGTIVDGVEVGEGMILNLNSFLNPDSLQSIFLDPAMGHSLPPMSQDSLFGDNKYSVDPQDQQN